MAAIDDIETSISNISATIAEITASPKPSYSIDGQTVYWNEYLETLTQKLQGLLKVKQLLGGPFQRATRVISK